MIHILAVLFGVAAIAIALAARQKKIGGALPIIGGGACLGLCFILTLIAVFSKEDSPEDDLFRVIGRAQWEYPLSVLIEKMGAPGPIAIIVSMPLPAPGSTAVSVPVNPMPDGCQLQGCSIFLQPLKAGQPHVTLESLNSAIKAGAKGIFLAAPLPAEQKATDESTEGVSEELLGPHIKVPIIAMSEPYPSRLQNFIQDGKLLGILSVKPNTAEVPDLKTDSAMKELFSARYQLLDQHPPQTSQTPNKTKENDNE